MDNKLYKVRVWIEDLTVSAPNPAAAVDKAVEYVDNALYEVAPVVDYAETREVLEDGEWRPINHV